MLISMSRVPVDEHDAPVSTACDVVFSAMSSDFTAREAGFSCSRGVGRLVLAADDAGSFGARACDAGVGAGTASPGRISLLSFDGSGAGLPFACAAMPAKA